MLAFVLPLFAAFSAGLPASRAQSVITAVVTDPLTGIALGGLDPVSYFTETNPLPGKPDFEFIWQGAPWYFATTANRDIFKGRPEIYAPQFGGHGTTGIARGFLSDSDPRVYAVFKQRLYLFYSAANREAFMLSPDAVARTAADNWPNLSKGLSTN